MELTREEIKEIIALAEAGLDALWADHRTDHTRRVRTLCRLKRKAVILIDDLDEEVDDLIDKALEG